MKAVEFESTLSPGGQISLPPGIATDIPVGEQLRIVVMWEPSAGADPEWVLARISHKPAISGRNCR
jgi:hypothetical protein